MPRILSGGGKNASGSPTTAVRGRPGFGSVARGFRQAARILKISDPANGVLSTPIGNVLKLGNGAKASLTTNMTGADNDLVFTAQEEGTEGNSIAVALVDPPGNNVALSVAVVGTVITVTLATDGTSTITSTATAVRNAVNAHAAASKLVVASLKAGNSGAGVVTALAQTSLSGGTEGETRQSLPPGLGAAPSGATVLGREESSITNPGIEITGRPVSDRRSNRSLRKR